MKKTIRTYKFKLASDPTKRVTVRMSYMDRLALPRVGNVLILKDGREVLAPVRRSRKPKAATAMAPGAGWRNFESVGAAVHRSQVKQFRDQITEQKLVGVEIKDNGRVTFSGRAARKKYLAARGLHDNDGGYGD